MTKARVAVLGIFFLGACKAETATSEGGETDAAIPGDPDGAVAGNDGAPTGDAPKGTSKKDGPIDTPKPDPDADYPALQCPDGAFFCDDFESGKLDTTKWVYDRPDGSGVVTFDTNRVRSGKRSIHFRLKDVKAGAHASIQSIPTFPVTSNNLNVRMFIYMDKLTPNRFTPIVSVAEFANKSDKQVLQLDVMPQSEKTPGSPVLFFYEFSANPTSAGGVPADRWACWELEMVNKTEVNFYLDGKLIKGLTQKVPANYADFNLPIWVGARLTHDNDFKNTFNLWVDDVVVSDKKIGCE